MIEALKVALNEIYKVVAKIKKSNLRSHNLFKIGFKIKELEQK